MILEAPVFTIDAALHAARFGVHRLELCSDFSEGGETPSVGALAFLKQRLEIPIFVMIRPRGGDFVYTEAELEVMERDIQILSGYGADGFVFGVLDAEGKVDSQACERLIKSATGKPCTFHRAFDVCADPREGMEVIISCGFQRILTSGGENSVDEGFDNILEYFDWAKDRVIIMPGGGLKPSHVSALKNHFSIKEVHVSCKSYRPSLSAYSHPRVRLSADEKAFSRVLDVDQACVEKFLEAMK